jgi:Na+/H+-dicarboxylate symporter
MAGENSTNMKILGLKLWQWIIIALALGVLVGAVVHKKVVKLDGDFVALATPVLGQEITSGLKAELGKDKLDAAKEAATSIEDEAVKASYLKAIDLHESVSSIKTPGKLFLNLIKMVIVPLIFFALVTGITSMDDKENFSRVGMKGVCSYIFTAMFAVIIGIVTAIVLQPGVVDKSQFADLIGAGGATTSVVPPSVSEFLIGLIPENIVKSMAEANYLHVVIFAVFTGIIMNSMGDESKKAKGIIHELAHVTFKMIEQIVKLAPIAVFAFIAWVVAKDGFELLAKLVNLVITLLVACGIQYLVFGLLIIVFARMSPIPFYKKIIPTQVMAFSTSSSKATLRTAMSELQTKLGVSEKSSNFLMPLGASINMDGTAIYLGICAVFFSQFYGVDLQMHNYLMLILTCTLGSIGAAGIPSGSIIFMSMVLASVGLPIDGIGIILGVDRILDMVRTTINITGDSAITLIIDKTEGTLNQEEYNA